MGRAFGKVSPARGGRFFAWVLDGASPDERAAVTQRGARPGAHDHRRGLRAGLPQGRRVGLAELTGRQCP